MELNVKGARVAIVTGATSGLGLEFVRQIAAAQVGEGAAGGACAVGAGVAGGADAVAGESAAAVPAVDELWVVARNAQKLEALKSQFSGHFKAVKAFACDLSDRESINVIAAALNRARPQVRLLINNAGFCKFGTYADLSAAESANMIDLNVTALVQMCVTCLPHMSRGARVLNVASLASFQPLPYMNIYSATKAFVRNYSRALNVELAPRGITVCAVCPGWMRTALFDRAEIGATRTVRNFVGITDPASVARTALADSARGRDISVHGALTKASHAAAKLLPQRTMMKIWLAQQHLK